MPKNKVKHVESKSEILARLVRETEERLEEIGLLADELQENVDVETDDGALSYYHGWQQSGGCEWEESDEPGHWSL